MSDDTAGLLVEVKGNTHDLKKQFPALYHVRLAGTPMEPGKGFRTEYTEVKKQPEYEKYLLPLEYGKIANAVIGVRLEKGGDTLYFTGPEVNPNCLICYEKSTSIKVVPFIPAFNYDMDSVPGAGHRHGVYSMETSKLLALPQGYVYIFRDGKLWRELFIDGKNKLRDIDVEYYRNLKNVGDGKASENGFIPNHPTSQDKRDTRDPVGVALDDIWIFESEIFSYRIMFSEYQLPWVRILYLEREETHALGRRAEFMELHPIEQIPSCLPRDPDREFAHSDPVGVARNTITLSDALNEAKKERDSYWEKPYLSQKAKSLAREYNMSILIDDNSGTCDGPSLGAANAIVEWEALEAKLSVGATILPEERKEELESLKEAMENLRKIFESGPADATILFDEEQKKRQINVVPVCAPWYTKSRWAAETRYWDMLCNAMALNALLDAKEQKHYKNASILYANVCVPLSDDPQRAKLKDRLDKSKMHEILHHTPRVSAHLSAMHARSTLYNYLQSSRCIEAFYDLHAQNSCFMLTGVSIWNEFLGALACNLNKDPLLGLIEPALRKKNAKMFELHNLGAELLPDAWKDAQDYSITQPLPLNVSLPENDGSGHARFKLLHHIAQEEGVKIKNLPPVLKAMVEIIEADKAESSDNAASSLFSSANTLVYHSIGNFFDIGIKKVQEELAANQMKYDAEMVKYRSGGLLGEVITEAENQKLLEAEKDILLRRATLINLGRVGPVANQFVFTEAGVTFSPVKTDTKIQLALYNITDLATKKKHLVSTPLDEAKTARLHYIDGGPTKYLVINPNATMKRFYVAVPAGSPVDQIFKTPLPTEVTEPKPGTISPKKGLNFFTPLFMGFQVFNIGRAAMDPSLKNAFDIASNLTDLIEGANRIQVLLRTSSSRLAKEIAGKATTSSSQFSAIFRLSPGSLTVIGAVGNVFAGASFWLAAIDAEKKNNAEAAFYHYIATGLAFGSVGAIAAKGVLSFFLPFSFGFCTPLSLVLIVAAIGFSIWASFQEEDDSPLRRCIVYGPLSKDNSKYTKYPWLEDADTFFYYLLSAVYPVHISCAKVSDLCKNTALTEAERNFFANMRQGNYVVSIDAPLLSALQILPESLNVNVEEERYEIVRPEVGWAYGVVGNDGDAGETASKEVLMERKPRPAKLLSGMPGTDLLRYEVTAEQVSSNILQHFNVFVRITGVVGHRQYPAPEITEGKPNTSGKSWYVYKTYGNQQTIESTQP